jgi:hypothetical protein
VHALLLATDGAMVEDWFPPLLVEPQHPAVVVVFIVVGTSAGCETPSATSVYPHPEPLNELHPLVAPLLLDQPPHCHQKIGDIRITNTSLNVDGFPYFFCSQNYRWNGRITTTRLNVSKGAELSAN